MVRGHLVVAGFYSLISILLRCPVRIAKRFYLEGGHYNKFWPWLLYYTDYTARDNDSLCWLRVVVLVY